MEGSENTKLKKGTRKKQILRHIKEELGSETVFGNYFYPGKSHKNTEVEGDRGIGVLMVMRGRVIVTDASRHGMYHLTVKSGTHNAETPVVNRFQKNHLPADEVFNEWCSIIASAHQEIPDVSYEVITKPHGRAIRLSVNCGSTRRNVVSVDLIPAMNHGRDFYIASPDDDTWQRSHTLLDKDGASLTSSSSRPQQIDAISKAKRRKNPRRTKWHSKPDVQTAVREFSDNNASIPRLAKKEAKDYNDKFLAKLRPYLRERGLSSGGFEYVGSSFEGLKIPKGLEFDILVILSGEVNAAEKRPGFYSLNKVGDAESNPITAAYKGLCLPPNEITSKFYGYLTNILDTYPDIRHKQVLRAHGPAVQLDVYRGSEVWYSVDLVPAFQSVDKLYVAKHYDNKAPEMDAWRLSYTLSEKRSLNDPSYASRRECVRILKALRARDPTLECITSYMLKTVLFHSSDDYPKESDWKRDLIGRNVLRLLEKLKKAMANGRLDNHKIPGLNLLKNLSEVTMEEVNQRLEKLTTKKEAFLKLLGK